MKTFLLLFLFPLLVLGQLPDFSIFGKPDQELIGKKIIDATDIVSKNSTIVRINDNYLILDDREGYKLTMIPNTFKIINKELLSQVAYKMAKKAIDTLSTINPAHLNIKENEKGERIDVNDGDQYSVQIYTSDSFVEYYSYSPQIYIENHYPFYIERKKFLKVYDSIRDLAEYKELENLLNADTIYIYYNEKVKSESPHLQKINFRKKEKYVFTFSEKDEIILQTYQNDSKNLTAPINSIKNNHTINLIDFDKYGYKHIKSIILAKPVYIIKKRDFNRKKISLKRAYLSYSH